MKRFVLLLPLLLLFSGARAQQQLGTPVVCDISSGLACLPGIQVGTGTSGMPAWESFGTLNTNTNIFNADFGQLYGMFGPSSHLVQNGSANASDITGLFSGACSSTTLMFGNGACNTLSFANLPAGVAPLASPAFTGSVTINGTPLLGLTSPALTGTPTINGFPIPTFPRTASEIAAGVTPSNYMLTVSPILDPLRYSNSYGGTTGDWLTAWQISLGYSAGSVPSAVGSVLTNSLQDTSVTPLAFIDAAHTKNVVSANQNAIAGSDYAVNDSPTYPVSIWGRYIEAHRINNVVGSAIGQEIDTTQRGALVGINPYIQNFGQAVALQLASGAQQGVLATATFATNVMTVTLVNEPSVFTPSGIVNGWRVSGPGMPTNTTISSFGTGTGGTGTYHLSTTPGTLGSRIVAISPLYDSTAAINIQANPNAFTTGINFGANAITGTDGINGVPSPAESFGRLQGMFWFAGASTGTGGIYNDATATAGASNLRFTQGSTQLIEVSTGALAVEINSTPNAANFLTLAPSLTTAPLQIIAAGSDTNIGINLIPKGSGTVNASGPIEVPSFTVATLNSSFPCTSGLAYAVAAVSDATSPTYNATLTGSGSVKTLAMCSGSAWTAH